jgi:hypothetical protein
MSARIFRSASAGNDCPYARYAKGKKLVVYAARVL